jgi:hypothetical protein
MEGRDYVLGIRTNHRASDDALSLALWFVLIPST